jgi:Polyketide cyclase / dehydrase and lipid transport
MTNKVTVTSMYNCTLERAFKTPMLCDVAKVHTGYGLMPKVTHCTADEQWGQVGSSKRVYAAKSLTQKGGFTSVDTIIDRIENKYWKFEVSDFQSWMLGFSRFTGEWRTTEIGKDKIVIEYTYTLHSNIALLYPLNWLFAKTFWKAYMKRVLENVKQMAYDRVPYMYD